MKELETKYDMDSLVVDLENNWLYELQHIPVHENNIRSEIKYFPVEELKKFLLETWSYRLSQNSPGRRREFQLSFWGRSGSHLGFYLQKFFLYLEEQNPNR